MKNPSSRRWRLALTVLLCLALPFPALAAKTFLGSDDAREPDEPQKFLANYDKLVGGKEADWVYFPAGVDLRSYDAVVVKPFAWDAGDKKTGERRVIENAAEGGKDYMTDWINSSNLGWKVGDSGDLTIEGNVFNAWEPDTAARVWGGWMASPGCGIEVKGTDSSGKLAFEIRHKTRGSSVEDCIENCLETIVDALVKGK